MSTKNERPLRRMKKRDLWKTYLDAHFSKDKGVKKEALSEIHARDRDSWRKTKRRIKREMREAQKEGCGRLLGTIFGAAIGLATFGTGAAGIAVKGKAFSTGPLAIWTALTGAAVGDS